MYVCCVIISRSGVTLMLLITREHIRTAQLSKLQPNTFLGYA